MPDRVKPRVTSTLAGLKDLRDSLDTEQAAAVRDGLHLIHQLLDAVRWTDDLMRVCYAAAAQPVPTYDQLVDAGWEDDLLISAVVNRSRLKRLIIHQLKHNRRLVGS